MGKEEGHFHAAPAQGVEPVIGEGVAGRAQPAHPAPEGGVGESAVGDGTAVAYSALGVGEVVHEEAVVGLGHIVSDSGLVFNDVPVRVDDSEGKLHG